MSALSGSWLINACSRHPDFYFTGECPACKADPVPLFAHTRRRMATYHGRTQSVRQWALELGLNYQAINWRVTHGWSVQRAFETPIGQDQDGQ